MENSELVISVLIVLSISISLIITGLKKIPGIGIVGAVAVIALLMWYRRDGLDALGFFAPESWWQTIGLGLVLGIVIQLAAVMVIEPFSEKITNTTHDHSVVDSVKGSWLAFVQWMLIVWIFVAFLEEGIYRGFLMTEIANILGTGGPAIAANILFTSVVFGLSHGYQSRSGMVSTGIVGVFLGVIFVASDFNVWLALMTHGFIDTVGIALIAAGKDKALRELVWKERA